MSEEISEDEKEAKAEWEALVAQWKVEYGYKDEWNYCIVNGEKREVGSGFKMMPEANEVTFCPICHACANEYFVEEEFELYCRHYGNLPDKFMGHNARVDCKYFKPNEKSRDWPMVKKEIEEASGTKK